MADTNFTGGVQLAIDGVPDSLCLIPTARPNDQGEPSDAEGVRDAEDRLGRVALQSPRRRAVSGLVAGPRLKVEDLLHGLGGDAAAVVADRHDQQFPSAAHEDGQHRGDADFFSGVQAIVAQLLEDDLREAFGGLPRHRPQLVRFEVFPGPREGEHLPLDGTPGPTALVARRVAHLQSPVLEWLTAAWYPR
jgi:hypothetical protein